MLGLLATAVASIGQGKKEIPLYSEIAKPGEKKNPTEDMTADQVIQYVLSIL